MFLKHKAHFCLHHQCQSKSNWTDESSVPSIRNLESGDCRCMRMIFIVLSIVIEMNVRNDYWRNRRNVVLTVEQRELSRWHWTERSKQTYSNSDRIGASNRSEKIQEKQMNVTSFCSRWRKLYEAKALPFSKPKANTDILEEKVNKDFTNMLVNLTSVSIYSW